MINYTKLFTDGLAVESDFGPVTLQAFSVGDLKLPTGQIVASDAFALEEVPFTLTVPAGSYPVVLSIAQFTDNDQRVAGAMIRFQDRRPVTWRMAMLPDQDPNELGPGEIYGFPVETTAACFLDRQTAETIVADEGSAAVLEEALEQSYVDTWSWANLDVAGDGLMNMVAFSSGMGDGLYASYFGLDEDQQPVCLVTDFALIDVEVLARD